ncbi:ABC transporter permease [Paenibacillus glycanilyticus]|uniref:ABC transporter permease n=1 Tax=Paenibacillus glycanilyticus TaxID=126569 RepID=UPI00203B9715|nr:ABC transporter permease [Paenibacillus glycanilyticus]MCM3626526.1 ABC transporter permease [Paenibacillus glycanilyticus]
MVNLVLNENMKIFRRARTWILIALMAAFVIFGNFVMWNENKSAQGEGWQTELTQQKEMWNDRLKNSSPDDESQTYYKEQIEVIDYHLEHNIRSEQGTMWNGINESAGLGILITIFTIIIAGDIVAAEFATGTIKLLLIRPANRLKILLSKYIAMLLFGLVLLFTLFVVSVLMNGILYGFKDIGLPLVSMINGHIVEQNMVLNLWKTYMLNGIATVMYVTIAFMISSVFRSSAMSIGFSIGILFAGNILLEALHRYEWSKYLLFANTDLTQYLDGRPFQDGMTLSFSIGVLVVYFLAFNLISWLMFTRRDVTA